MTENLTTKEDTDQMWWIIVIIVTISFVIMVGSIVGIIYLSRWSTVGVALDDITWVDINQMPSV